MSRARSLGRPASPARLFDTLAGRPEMSSGHLEGFYEVLAQPGEILARDLRAGDLLVRRALGEGDLAEVIPITQPSSLRIRRLGRDQLLVRPRFPELPTEQPAVPPVVPAAGPDSPLAARFIAAHPSRFCTPGQAGSGTCSSLTSPRAITRVIIHVLGVPSTSRRSGVEAVVAGWQQPARPDRRAAAHYLVDRDGTITQMVRENNAAFHTPGNNRDSIGIEHADVCNDPAPLTVELYEASAALVRDLASRHGFAIHPGTVAGHHQVAGNHADPGPYWDWEYYFLLLAWDGVTTTSRPRRWVAAAHPSPAPAGWSLRRRRAIPNDHCATRRDPWGATYWRARPSATGAPAELSVIVDEPGTYKVSLWWPDVSRANSATPVDVVTACISSPCSGASTVSVVVNQRPGFGRWNDIATVAVPQAPMEVKVRIRRDSSDSGWILADGLRVLKIASSGTLSSGGDSAGGSGDTERFESPDAEAIDRSSSGYVRWLQEALNRVNAAGLSVDGILGQRTRRAIQAFQRSRGLTANGISGPPTEAALVAAGAAPPPGSLPGSPCGESAGVLDHFAHDRADLTPAHGAALDRLAADLLASRQGPSPVTRVCLIGHSDSTGSQSHNLGLAQRRAAAVERELRQRLETASPGSSASWSFEVLSRGESEPVASNATAEGRARNRRVEILFARGAAQVATVHATPKAAELAGPDSWQGEAWLAEVDPEPPVILPVGPTGILFSGTGSPEPGTFAWSTDDPAIARVSPTSSPEWHPNDALFLGLSPGITTVVLRYRTSSGAIATWSRDLVVTRAAVESLFDPAGRPCPGPVAMARPISRSGGVAHRAVQVRFEPVAFWAGKEVEWTFAPVGALRGALPAGRHQLEAQSGFNFTPGTRRSRVNVEGRAAVRVHLPDVSLNRGRLTVRSVDHPTVTTEVRLEVPGRVVVDAGHGGTAAVPGSSPNNAVGTVSGVLEKRLSLDLALRLRDALLTQDHLVEVFLTRDDDFNVPGADRARLAKVQGADIFISLHLNGSNNPARRGTSTFIRAVVNGNVNHAEDHALAERVQAAAFGAIPGGRNLGVFDDTASSHPTGLAVLNDTNHGNTAALHPIRACLLESEFLSNADADRQLNLAPNHLALRQSLAEAVARALVDDLEHQP